MILFSAVPLFRGWHGLLSGLAGAAPDEVLAEIEKSDALTWKFPKKQAAEMNNIY